MGNKKKKAPKGGTFNVFKALPREVVAVAAGDQYGVFQIYRKVAQGGYTVYKKTYTFDEAQDVLAYIHRSTPGPKNRTMLLLDEELMSNDAAVKQAVLDSPEGWPDPNSEKWIPYRLV